MAKEGTPSWYERELQGGTREKAKIRFASKFGEDRDPGLAFMLLPLHITTSMRVPADKVYLNKNPKQDTTFKFFQQPGRLAHLNYQDCCEENIQLAQC